MQDDGKDASKRAAKREARYLCGVAFILMCVSVGVEIAALAAVNFAVERLLKKEGERNE